MTVAETEHTDYAATLNYLYARLPMFSRIGAAALKPDLTNTIALCEALGNPQRTFKSIHIAGTNGKGSTSHMLAAIFADAGYKTGLYTSPHLIDFRERIRVNGAMVSQDFVVQFVGKTKAAIERINPSFFEVTVAMAFAAFAEAGVDIAIIETGLGGRLDSTNVITPELSVITNISLDHTELLGADIPSIAREKAGIIKAGIPVVIGELHPESLPVFEHTAHGLSAPLTKAWETGQIIARDRTAAGDTKLTYRRLADRKDFVFVTDLDAPFQEKNIRTVLAAIAQLDASGWRVSLEASLKSLRSVRRTTGLRGRMEVLSNLPLILADVAHNPAGIAALMDFWRLRPARHKHVLIGFVRDKDIATALKSFPPDAIFHFCAAAIPRALPAEELKAAAAELGIIGTAHDSVHEGIRAIKRQLGEEDALLITGSFFIVGEALEALS